MCPSDSYYQQPEPVIEYEDDLDCDTCDANTVHRFTAWFKDGPLEAECLDCGSVEEIELD